MPAEYIATMMENNFVVWRARFSIPEEGPKDKRLIIHFSGDLSELPWLHRTYRGFEIDFDALWSSARGTFNCAWFPDGGTAPVQIQGIGNEFVMSIQL